MVKQSIFGRIAQLAKANINALLDAAEDPQKMLDQMVRDYTNNMLRMYVTPLSGVQRL